MIMTPLEQFQIISLFSIKLFCLDFSLTNLVLINSLVLLIYIIIIFCFSNKTTKKVNNSFFLIPSSWQTLVETIYDTNSPTYDNINTEGERYLPFVSVIFTFILFNQFNRANSV